MYTDCGRFEEMSLFSLERMDGILFVFLSLWMVPHLWRQREDKDLHLIESVDSFGKRIASFCSTKRMSCLIFVLETLFRTLWPKTYWPSL
ncbi:hypothetical protein AVEN_38368-1 [Araneus ventricosus]|uniref:Uncharacterized protein n=1 Tax=Araneus ventricosus TaxID=182803 RepID=A0A4Y2J8Q2_ARAVE|nr:hypothetical protein AVEN_38368-1 [Araneus ventricosus]